MKLFGNKKKSKKTDVEKPASKKRLTKLQKILIISGAVLCALILSGIAAWNLYAAPPDVGAADGLNLSVTDDLDKSSASPNATDGSDADAQALDSSATGRKDGFYTILLVGTDHVGANTDTIIVVGFDTENNKLSFISIPRDTMVDVTRSVKKINAAYSAAGLGDDGIAELKSEVKGIIGFDVDCYAMIDLNAFCEVVDLIGGVDFDVPMRMKYSDPSQDLYIDLQAGYQNLDGNEAMQLVRFRSGYAAADIQRINVQQQFMKAIANQVLQIENFTKIKGFMKIISENLTTDLSYRNMVWFAQQLMDMDSDNINFYTMPGSGTGYYHGASYYTLYGQSVVDLVNENINPYTTDITLSDVDIITTSGGSIITSSGSGDSVTDFSWSGSSGSSSSSSSHSSSSSSSSSNSHSSGSESSSNSTATVTSKPVTETDSSSTTNTESGGEASPSPSETVKETTSPTVSAEPSPEISEPVETTAPEATVSPSDSGSEVVIPTEAPIT